MKRTDDARQGPDRISRRSFLESGALAAAALGAGPALRPGGAVAGEGTRGGASRQPASPPPFELDEITLAQLQDGLRAGRYTARSLTEAYLGRIVEIDGRGPTLRSVIETNPDALRLADALDAERRAGKVRGPLHGIPVLVKDNIASDDRMQTTAGSLALVGSKVPRDAFIVGRLREAGAVLLGKTNLSEWANFRSTRSSSGWSGRGGQCVNPYALDRSPCGSSSGTGIAVSANLCAVGAGTETDGSVVCPSATNGIVGVKPTLGLVSRAGIVPISHNQDTAGPMARTVTDAAILLGVMAGIDPRDPATAASRGHARADYTTSLDPAGLEGARIGVARAHFFGYSPEADALVEAALDAMKRHGAVLVDPADIPHTGDYDESENVVLQCDFKADLNHYLAELVSSPVRSLADVIAFNDTHRAQEMPYFGQEIMIQSEARGPLTDPAYREALEKDHRLTRTEGIDAVMDRYRLDALVAPTGSPAWTIDLVNGDHFLGSSSSPAAVAGYASVTVPVGYAYGLPVGMSFIGRAWSEATLLKLAYAYEQATRLRRTPTFELHPELIGRA